jgi:hypothetical protein
VATPEFVLYSHTIPVPHLLPAGFLRPNGKEFTDRDFAKHDPDKSFFNKERLKRFRLDPQDPSREVNFKRSFAVDFRAYLTMSETQKERTEIIYDAVSLFGKYPDYVTKEVGPSSWDAICTKSQLHSVLGITDWYRATSRFPPITKFAGTISALKEKLKKAIISISGLHHKMWVAIPEVELDYEKTWKIQKFQILSMVTEELNHESETFDELKAFSKTALSALDDESWDFMRDGVTPRMRDFLYPYYTELTNRLDGKFSLQDFAILSCLTQTRFLGKPPSIKAEAAKRALLEKASAPFEIDREYVREVMTTLGSYARFHGMENAKEAYSAMYISVGTASCTEAPVKDYGKSEGLRKGLDTCRRMSYEIPERNIETGEIIKRWSWEDVKMNPIVAGFHLSVEMMISAMAESPKPFRILRDGNWVEIATTDPPIPGIKDGKILDIEEPGKPRLLIKGSVFAYLGTTPLAKGLLYLLAKDPQFTRGICGSNHPFGHIERLLECDSFVYDRQGLIREVCNASVDAKTATDDLDRAKAMTLVHAFGSAVFGRNHFYLNLCTKFSMLPIETEDGLIKNTTPMGMPLSKLALTLSQAHSYEWARNQVLLKTGRTRFDKNEERYVYGADPETMRDASEDVLTRTGGEPEPREPASTLVVEPAGLEAQRLKVLRNRFFGLD